MGATARAQPIATGWLNRADSGRSDALGLTGQFDPVLAFDARDASASD